MKSNKLNFVIAVFFVLGCMTFALLYSTVFAFYYRSNQNVALAKNNKTETLLTNNTEKKYSDVKDILAQYSTENISTLNSNEATKEEGITETKQIALNVKSSVDEHLLAVKKAKEQQELEKQAALKAQQEAEARKQAASQAAKADSVKVTAYERDLLERLVEAEAGGEPYEGKLAVATVVINRVKSNQFPNTIHGVIYQKNQFSPVENGAINRKASAESKRAVSQVVDEGYRSFSSDVLYFLNPNIATSKWIVKNRTFVKTIGSHHFYK